VRRAAQAALPDPPPAVDDIKCDASCAKNGLNELCDVRRHQCSQRLPCIGVGATTDVVYFLFFAGGDGSLHLAETHRNPGRSTITGVRTCRSAPTDPIRPFCMAAGRRPSFAPRLPRRSAPVMSAAPTPRSLLQVRPQRNFYPHCSATIRMEVERQLDEKRRRDCKAGRA